MESRRPLFSILYSHPSRRGQTIVEAIVAVSTLLTGFLGIFTLLGTSLHNSRIVSDNTAATYLAAEGIEVVKNILDHNVIMGASWSSGFSPGDFEDDYTSTVLSPYVGTGRNLSFNTATNLYGYGGGDTQTTFKRRIRIAFYGSDEIGINSIVSWTTGRTQSSVNLEDHFLNWRP